MSKMINRIFKDLDFNLFEQEEYCSLKKRRFINKSVYFPVDDLKIKIRLTQNGFDTVWINHLHKSDYLVPPNEAADWIKENVVGNIDKTQLDEERVHELRKVDLMKNTGIIYHSESIYEMQFIALCWIWLHHKSINKD